MMGLNVINGKLKVKDLLARLREMLPSNEIKPLEDFDESKSGDKYYCVEWGMRKGQWQEQAVLERYINELETALAKDIHDIDPETRDMMDRLACDGRVSIVHGRWWDNRINVYKQSAEIIDMYSKKQ